jgi:DNA (cytosine-5)-methyltransferase 1
VIFGSVCSGIEAASAAWHPLGWRCAFMSEIEAFPRAVLKHHYQETPLHGDFTTIKADEYESIDVLVGGTPCQSFSVAGLRGGMADERGNLALEYLRLADRLRPRWLVWENVPGVLSSGGGRDFGSFVGGLGELGYGWAYRTLDAQYFGLAQRRKRVFVVGYIGDWRRAAAVLFEPASLRGDSSPSRTAREGIAPSLAARTRSGGGLGTDFDCDGGLIAGPLSSNGGTERKHGFGMGQQDRESGYAVPVAMALNAHGGSGRMDGESETFVTTLAIRGRGDSHDLEWRNDGTANAVLTPNGGRADIGVGAVHIAHSLRADGFDASEDGTGRGTPLVAFAQNQRDEVRQMDIAGALASEPGMKQTTYAFQTSQSGVRGHGTHATLYANNGSRRHNGAMIGSAVRRLTPVECCRLQGFPDNYLDIEYRGKPTADGPKYRALGNSMAVPVMRWIGRRIQMVEQQT